MTKQLTKQTIGVGVAGTGFIGPAHIEGLRRNGINVLGLAENTKEKAERKAADMGIPRIYGSLDELLADPAVSIFIAEENREAIGYIFCKLIERPENPFTFAMRSLLVEHISVRPAARGKGVGTALMKQAEMLAKALAVQRIQLDSWDFNADAHSFFERLGFQRFIFRFWRPV